ncbi:putative outer membrane protein [Myroides odoratimimus]|uniref:RagB/SusD family nutrient uptake outer membrane protein n=2 Tax=Myroides odoratimimus TaxID=76832 RepID=UPI0007256FDC|nr:RagB/SusD family nutrient uptake outer membrane protein [Myroides odoratimimus]MDM1060861.1 RagB/SusD family nutrient uptake outer membrane protein [Myroides odoratimimus]MDM1067312.1 RagB/SusD family nutrient uptake outer membrane protein [Myroides odoratimimus]MDM1086203.1 RagB/SusD family nutrient uptake outer membrane protein [Myroides odoratimimus]MDM1510960.1 RagB/SusD family nutrient uptake outer membrane protein [Myroides odoratimimus]MEC4076584.1 RagB/SusD family nutrient uptake ou
MKIIFYSSLLFLAIILFQSCEETIDIGLPTDQIATENVFKDKRSAISALADLYINLREASIFSGKSLGIGSSLGLYTDELEPIYSSPESDNVLLYNNSLDPTRYVISTLWDTSYSNIYAINAFISGVINSEGITSEEKEKLIAQASILRAMYYQSLTQIYGNIPYSTSTDYKANTKIVKTPVFDVLKLIEQDLLKAVGSLSYSDESSNKYYPNKAVAELILAKNYLLQKKYEKAELYAKLVMDNPLYSLETDISKVFKNPAKSTLWQMANTTPVAATYEARNFILFSNNSGNKLNNSLLASFDNNDLRKQLWIKEFEDTGSFYSFKYKNRLNNTDECSILFRIEEAYFILSEALIYQNREKEAIVYLNSIRQRANLLALPNTLDKEQTLLAMLKESQKEFFLEHGRRFFDLKRNNKLSLLKIPKPNWQDKHALFPYPEKEILINPNLNPQNDY